MLSYLLKGSGLMGIELSEKKAARMLSYMGEVLEANKTMNLTSVTEEAEFIELHILDSLSILSLIPEGASLLDVGTGAGFPGVILKIAREDIRLTLIDSTLKKLNFVKGACEKLNIGVEDICHGRAEELSTKAIYRNSFDVLTARAVSKLPMLCEYCIPFVKKGGIFVAMKGRNVSEEIFAAADISEKLGAPLKDTLQLELPYSKSRRCLVIYEKLGETPGQYPRKNLKKLYK